MSGGAGGRERVGAGSDRPRPTGGATIDETVAWALVSAVGAPAGVEAPHAAAAGRHRVATVADAWLEADRDGSWSASAPVSDAARELLDLYLPVRLAPEIVVGQLGQSLDGRIATEVGASHYVTGPDDIVRLHRLRALVDAVIVGAGTVESDDPRITVRATSGADPVRVVLDPHGRLDDDRLVFSDDDAARTLRVRRGGSGPGRAASPGRYEELCVAALGDGRLDLTELLRELRGRGLRRVLVEGGGVTVSRFLEAGLLDRLHITVAPMLIGSGRPSLTLAPIDSLDDALRPRCRLFRLGDDVLFDLDLRAARSD